LAFFFIEIITHGIFEHFHQVSLIELSQRQPSIFQVLQGGASVLLPLLELAGTESGRMLVNFLVKEAALPASFTSGRIQARMDDISTDITGRGLQ
jgi:hypothetical protein